MTASSDPPDSLAAPGSRLPEFFMVGHPKSGTTALYEMLRRHPQIYMPTKGMHFFAPELHPHSLDSDSRPATLEEYLGLFTGVAADRRTGEASSSYLRSPVAAARLAELQPDARIVAILREPASFLRSLHLELLQEHVETEKDLRKAIAAEEARRRSERIADSAVQPGFKYSAERVRYVDQLRRYYDVFAREQVLVLIYDDFRADNEGTVRAVLRFLGVDDGVAVESIEANPTVAVRSVRVDGFVRSLYLGRGPVGRVVKAGVKALAPRRLRRGGLEALQRRVLYGAPAAPDAELMLELRRRFKGEVVALSEYLDRDLVTLWGYDSIE
jgi:Sulfotransferase domain